MSWRTPMTLGAWQQRALHVADCDLNVVVWWFDRYEPIGDED